MFSPAGCFHSESRDVSAARDVHKYFLDVKISTACPILRGEKSRKKIEFWAANKNRCGDRGLPGAFSGVRLAPSQSPGVPRPDKPRRRASPCRRAGGGWFHRSGRTAVMRSGAGNGTRMARVGAPFRRTATSAHKKGGCNYAAALEFSWQSLLDADQNVRRALNWMRQRDIVLSITKSGFAQVVGLILFVVLSIVALPTRRRSNTSLRIFVGARSA